VTTALTLSHLGLDAALLVHLGQAESVLYSWHLQILLNFNPSQMLMPFNGSILAIGTSGPYVGLTVVSCSTVLDMLQSGLWNLCGSSRFHEQSIYNEGI
jgi:hypothetical protein